MLRLAPLLFLVTASAPSGAQSLNQYLTLRKQHQVQAATTHASLASLRGTRVVELAGRVKGSFSMGNRTSLMVEFLGGNTSEVVEAAAIPEWLLGNDVPARLLVRATRADETSGLRLALIGAARHEEMAAYDARTTAAPVARTRTGSRQPQVTATVGKSGRGLYGPIGRQPASRKGSKRRWSLPASEVTPIYAAFIKKVNPRLGNSDALRIAEAVVGFSLKYEVDARLIMAMVMVESGFDPDAVSSAGASGLGQLMPGTARWMGVQDPFDTTQNLYGTVKLMRTHLDDYKKKTGQDFESLVLSLAAYNAGMGAVKRHGGVPPYRETQRYVRKVIGLYYRFAGQG